MYAGLAITHHGHAGKGRARVKRTLEVDRDCEYIFYKEVTMKSRFGVKTKGTPSKKYPNRKAVSLSNEGLEAFTEVAKRLPDLEDADIQELAILVLRDASPASIRKYYNGKDLIAEARVKEAAKETKRNGKKEAVTQEGAIPTVATT